MSFLLDPPLLVATGAALERVLPDERAKRLAAAAVVGTYVGVSAGLYLNRPRLRWFWRLFGAETGRDWMLNSGVLRFDHERSGPATHAVAAAIFATYPLWYSLGRRLGRR